MDDEVGVIGEGEEVVEESADEGEEVRESEESEEEEEILLVSNILSCQHTRNGTIKYICQYSGYAPEDTSLEPASMIQPKQVLLDYRCQERARADGSFPPSKPSPKRKKAAPKAKGAPRGRTKAASAAGPSRASKRTRGSGGPPKSWNPERLYPSDEDESEEDVASLFKMHAQVGQEVAQECCSRGD